MRLKTVVLKAIVPKMRLDKNPGNENVAKYG